MHFVILGIVVLALCYLVISRNSTFPLGPRRHCNWREDKRRTASVMTRWTCRSCGVEAYSSDGGRPKECKRHLRDSRL